MKNRKSISIVVLAVLLVLAGFVALTQTGRWKQPENKTFAADTSDNGILTNDDPWSEINRLVDAYYGKEGMIYSGTIKLIDDNEEQEKILEEKTFSCELHGEESYYQFGSAEIINRKNFIMTVDHDEKMVAVSPVLRKRKKDAFDMKLFRKLMKEQQAEAKVTLKGSFKILTIDKIQHPDIQGYQVYYDPQTYRIIKIIAGMQRLYSLNDDDSGEPANGPDEIINEKPNEDETVTVDTSAVDEIEITAYYYYLEIEYKEAKAAEGKGKFSPELKYVRFNNGKEPELLPAYHDYRLLNQAAEEENPEE